MAENLGHTDHLYTLSRWQKALAIGSLMVMAGCSSDQMVVDPVASTTTTVSTPESDTTSTSLLPESSEKCFSPEIPVFPNSALNPENANDIQKQLDTLATAQDASAPVTLSDFLQASSIVANSLRDNVYAHAFSYARETKSQVLTATELLGVGFVSTTDCLDSGQLREVRDLFSTLADGLAPKAGRQISAAARVAYDNFKQSYEDFKQKYHQELEN